MDNTKKNDKKNINSNMNIIKGGNNTGLYIFLVVVIVIVLALGFIYMTNPEILEEYFPDILTNLFEHLMKIPEYIMNLIEELKKMIFGE